MFCEDKKEKKMCGQLQRRSNFISALSGISVDIHNFLHALSLRDPLQVQQRACVCQWMAWSKQLKVTQASCFVLVWLAHVPVLGHWLQEINGELHVLLIFSPRGLPVIQQKLKEWCSQRHDQSSLLNINAETLKISSVKGEFHWFLKCQ